VEQDAYTVIYNTFLGKFQVGKTSNPKSQISNNIQAPISKSPGACCLVIEVCLLFGA
jgi:hypothetical protein